MPNCFWCVENRGIQRGSQLAAECEWGTLRCHRALWALGSCWWEVVVSSPYLHVAVPVCEPSLGVGFAARCLLPCVVPSMSPPARLTAATVPPCDVMLFPWHLCIWQMPPVWFGQEILTNLTISYNFGVCFPIWLFVSRFSMFFAGQQRALRFFPPFMVLWRLKVMKMFMKSSCRAKFSLGINRTFENKEVSLHHSPCCNS